MTILEQKIASIPGMEDITVAPVEQRPVSVVSCFIPHTHTDPPPNTTPFVNVIQS